MTWSALEASHAFSMLDIELARAFRRLSGEDDPDLAYAVALASREVQDGHVCADLARFAGKPLDDDATAAFPEHERWLERLRASALVAGANDDLARPLVLDERGRLYLARYFDHERTLGALVRARAEASHREVPPPAPTLVAQLFPSEKPDLQRDAALAARNEMLSIIVGGPGTGKTSTVVKLLALLVHDALRQGQPAPRTLLVAPTGKAAQRLTESIEKARDRLAIDEPIKAAITSTASTLHRALGPLDDSLTRFRYGPSRPLEYDLVLLDEASMVDLALMRRFFAALPAHARVILLGDPDQLASVEAGGVLADLCRAAEQPASPLAPLVRRLTQSYRYPDDSGIAALARAVHVQDPERALEVLRAGHTDVTFHPAVAPRQLGRALEREVKQRYRGLRDPDLATKLATLDEYRVLAAHRTGPASVEQLNPLIARSLSARGASYPGRPIMITQNDYATSLFNGDVGVLHATKKRELMACFRVGEGSTRDISLARLPAHESAYAMTVHKSQGSEFDHVAIVLPERPSRILSRELLYTAITRAKHGLSVYANEVSLRAAIEQRVERSSGLVDRLSR